MAHSKEQHLRDREYQQQENHEREILQKHYGIEEVNGSGKGTKIKSKTKNKQHEN